MKKLKRAERISLIVKHLVDNPNKVIKYNDFDDYFEAAKSSISEDLAIIKKALEAKKSGYVITLAGATGGVKYLPRLNNREQSELLADLKATLCQGERAIAGGYLYIADILYDPKYIKGISQIFAERYREKKIDCVMTIETKGIPLAFMTAQQLAVPLVIVRKKNKVTDGATVSINYVSGSSNKLGQMFVHKRALKKADNVLIIDDVMKGGGTIKGLMNLVAEFDANVVGSAVFLELDTTVDKMVADTFALLKLRIKRENLTFLSEN